MRLFTFLAAISVSAPIVAQTDADALRYSMIEHIGSARVLGAGSAFTALGADLAAITINPASIGQFRASEIAFSPSFHTSSTSAAFFGNTETDGKLNMNVSNFGLVFSRSKGGSGRGTPGAWESINWGFGYNRLANYNDRVTLSGVNPGNSLIDRFVEEANGTFANDLYNNFPFGAGLAYDAFLFDPNPDSVSYSSRVPDGGITQTKEIRSRGSQDEWYLAFGGNIANSVLIGASLGLPSIDYREESWHTEEDHADTIAGFTKFTQYNWLQTRGTGINGKFGVTGLIGTIVRVGAAFHTPSYIGLRDGYYTFIENEQPDITEESPTGEYRYALVTPWRANAGLAVMAGRSGFVSVDYEYVDYSKAKFNFRGDQTFEDQVNGDIQSKYGPASNVRVGGELVLGAYRVRAGAQFLGSPFQDGVAAEGADYSRTTYSGGVGFRGRSFFIDLTYALSMTNQQHVPYLLADANEVVGGALIDKNYHNVLITTGLKLR